MKYGIILAGGRGTRLGPLAAQISKALVSVGSRPQVINQIEKLRTAGCERIVVVTSPSTDTQVSDVLQRAGAQNVSTVVQKVALGPGHALQTGLDKIRWTERDSVYVIMSDTVIDEHLPDREFIGVAFSTIERSWCWLDNERGYVDEVAPEGTEVTIGVYRFDDIPYLSTISMFAMPDDNDEYGMANLLSMYTDRHDVPQIEFPSWQDVGDVLSLGTARRDRYVSRAHHRLELSDSGRAITKYGASDYEIGFMWQLANAASARKSLFPTVYGIHENTYTMEYIDLPSLAELWLYWPGLPETWAGIVDNVITQLDRDLWTNVIRVDEHLGLDFYANKAMQRINVWRPDRLTEEFTERIKKAGSMIEGQFAVNGHGDLNFTNILYSLNTGAVKLIDPRGGLIPDTYEYVKLAYSPYYAAITHNLFHFAPNGRLLLHPIRTDEIEAIHEILAPYVGGQRELYAAMGLTLLAAVPLHTQDQAAAFWYLGNDFIGKAID